MRSAINSESIRIAGDTLFMGSVGRTDFEGGDAALLKKSIQQRIYKLDKSAAVVTGTDRRQASGGKCASTLLFALDRIIRSTPTRFDGHQRISPPASSSAFPPFS
jgi:glyoxylase-like metal-dependent hydrolase (beta-lactamase superfamily II)